MRYFLSISFVILLYPISASHIRMNAALQKAFALSAELRLEEADKIIDGVERSEPNNRATDYLRGAILTVKLFINEDKQQFEQQKDQMDHFIAQLEKAPDSDPQKRFMISQLKLGLAILNGYYKNNITAGWQFYKAYNLLKENQRKFPSYYPNYVPLGVLYAAIGSLPSGYQGIASVIGIEGGVKEGMAMIHKGYWNTISDPATVFYRDYFGFIYSYTSLSLVGNSDISPSSLSLKYQSSSYLTYMQAQVEIEKGNAAKALEIMKNRPRGPEYYPYPYLDYFTGKIALAFSEETAIIYLLKFLRERNSDNYIKSAYRYLSWAYMLKGDKTKQEYYRQLILTKGQAHTGADKQALREAQSGYNEILIKGRIWFDGGLYQKAATYLEKYAAMADSFPVEEQVEYHYRLGRIYQESGNFTKALSEFSRAMQYKLAEASFNEANSVLQSAFILEKMGAKERALKYFHKTLTYSGFPFYEGLHQQAKSGIDRLR